MCGVDVMAGVWGVVLGGSVSLWCVDWCVGGMVVVVVVEGALPVYIWRRAVCEGELGCWWFAMGEDGCCEWVGAFGEGAVGGLGLMC